MCVSVRKVPLLERDPALAVPVATSQCITERDADTKAVWFACNVAHSTGYVGRRNAALYYSATMPIAMHCLGRALPPAVDDPPPLQARALCTHVPAASATNDRFEPVPLNLCAANGVNELVGGARFRAQEARKLRALLPAGSFSLLPDRRSGNGLTIP